MTNPFSKVFALAAAKRVFSGKGGDTKMGKRREELKQWLVRKLRDPTTQLRMWMWIPVLMIFVAVLLNCFGLFAGANANTLTDVPVFTVNVSRIGEGIHQNIDGAIADFNVDDLRIKFKRSQPIEIPAPTASFTTIPVTITAAPTMAPRDVGSVFESLTGEAGDNIESANSAVRSKATFIRSKASSAAESAATNINGALDGAADKVKGELKQLVDDSFNKIRSELALPGFYNVYMQTTCEGVFENTGEKDKNNTEIFVKKINGCKKSSVLNPLRWVSIFFYASLIAGGISLLLSLMAIYKPGGRWINWTLIFVGAACVIQAIGSAIAHGIAESASRVLKFIGGPITIDSTRGIKFVGMTWTATLLFLLAGLLLWNFRRHINKHPEKAMSSGSDGSPGGSLGLGRSLKEDDSELSPRRPQAAHAREGYV